MDLESIFNDVSDQMKMDFDKARTALSHPVLKGTAYEEAVRSFFRLYLPQRIEISSGTIVDSKGRQSRQLDIILNDAFNTPVFFQSADIRVIPSECTYAVIEVKAFLDKSELLKAFTNMQSVKSMTKIAFFESNGIIKTNNNLYGKSWSYWPIHYFVFAYDSPNIESVLSNLELLQKKTEIHNRIDCVCVLNRGVILNQGSDGMYSCLPTPGSTLKASLTTKPLLLFYSMLSLIINQANMRPFNIIPYIDKLKF